MSDCGGESCDGPSVMVKTKEILIEGKNDYFIKGRDGPLNREKFLTFMIRTFRASIHHKCLIKKTDKLLISFSGGYSSRALLHLLEECWTSDEKKHLGISIQVLFVDTSDVFKTKIDLDSVAEVCKLYNLDLHVEKMEMKEYQEDLFEFELEKTIVNFARRANISKVLLGQNGTRMSCRLISDTSKGRGFSLPFTLSYIDNHHGDVLLLHPMRYFLSKEVAFYNFHHKLEICPMITGFLRTNTTTISNLSETFIIKLQSGFPSTVHTILSSSEKLSVDVTEKECLVCGL